MFHVELHWIFSPPAVCVALHELVLYSWYMVELTCLDLQLLRHVSLSFENIRNEFQSFLYVAFYIFPTGFWVFHRIQLTSITQV